MGESEPITRWMAGAVVAIVVLTFGASGYAFGLQARINANTERIAAVDTRLSAVKQDLEDKRIGEMPEELNKVKRLLCVGGDATRERECRKMGIIE